MTAASPSIKQPFSQFLIFVLALVSACSLHAQDFGNDDEFLPVEEAYQVLVEHSEDGIEMTWNIAPGYYLYQERFKVVARNAETSEELPLDLQDGKVKYDEYFEKELTVYYYSTTVKTPLPSLTAPYEVVVHSMGCADAGLCYPPRRQYFDASSTGLLPESPQAIFDPSANVTSSVDEGNTEESPVQESSAGTLGFFTSIIFAFLGGIILNLMPCVFPVLSLKALSFASSKLNPHQQHLHGWAYTAGVVVSFFLVGLIILGGALAIGWGMGTDGAAATPDIGYGFQMQIPAFVLAMVYLFFLMGLSLSGMFQIGTSLMGTGQSLTTGHGFKASFFTGVLAAVVASPCTGPLMAPAVGAALAFPLIQGLLVFIALGLGLAAPFLLLSYNPKLAEKLPHPGQWMVTLKEFLAYPMYATAIWLLWVFGNQTGTDGAILGVIGALLFCFAIWLFKLDRKPGWLSKAVIALAIAAIVLGLSAAHKATEMQSSSNRAMGEGETWIPYSPDKLAELRAEGTPVFIDLTADWCITCKFNERVALTEAFEERARELGVVLMVGDWTNSDPDITALLKKYKRSGVPLYLMYPKDQSEDAEILPQLLNESLVLAALERTQ